VLKNYCPFEFVRPEDVLCLKIYKNGPSDEVSLWILRCFLGNQIKPPKGHFDFHR